MALVNIEPSFWGVVFFSLTCATIATAIALVSRPPNALFDRDAEYEARVKRNRTRVGQEALAFAAAVVALAAIFPVSSRVQLDSKWVRLGGIGMASLTLYYLLRPNKEYTVTHLLTEQERVQWIEASERVQRFYIGGGLLGAATAWAVGGGQIYLA